jgi:hypothetical protein
MLIRFASIVAVGALASHMAFAAPCVKPADIAAFNVMGLKTRLMVTALSCNAGKAYSAFAARFRPVLAKEDRRVRDYFRRVHGRRGGQEYAAYVAALANAQSLFGSSQHRAFCAQGLAIFRQAMKLEKVTSVVEFAAAKQPVQPIALAACSLPRRAVRTAEAGAASPGS